MCEKCENPETVLKVLPKRGIINSSCKACGHNFVVDMRHKLSTFILRNPPEQDLDKAGTSLTKKQVHVCVKQYLGLKNELKRLPSWNFHEQHSARYIIIQKWTPFLLRDALLLDRRSIDLSGAREKEGHFHYKNFLSASKRYHMPYLLHHPQIPKSFYCGLGLIPILSKGIWG